MDPAPQQRPGRGPGLWALPVPPPRPAAGREPPHRRAAPRASECRQSGGTGAEWWLDSDDVARRAREAAAPAVCLRRGRGGRVWTVPFRARRATRGAGTGHRDCRSSRPRAGRRLHSGRMTQPRPARDCRPGTVAERPARAPGRTVCGPSVSSAAGLSRRDSWLVTAVKARLGLGLGLGRGGWLEAAGTPPPLMKTEEGGGRLAAR